MILDNGVIRTMDPSLPTCGALAIAGPLVAGGVGTHEAALPSPDLVDLGGRCVIPAFTDGHVHFPTWALARRDVPLDGVPSLAEALDRVAGHPRNGTWIRGTGWRDALWAERATRAALDTVTGALDAGAQVDDASWGRMEQRVRDELRNHFRPEFLNRVDDIIVFRPLSREDLVAIVDIQLRRLADTLAQRHLRLEVTPEAKAGIAAQGYDPVYGARPLKRVIQRELQNPIAIEILEGNFHEGDTIRVERAGDHLRFVRAAGVPERASA